MATEPRVSVTTPDLTPPLASRRTFLRAGLTLAGTCVIGCTRPPQPLSEISPPAPPQADAAPLRTASLDANATTPPDAAEAASDARTGQTLSSRPLLDRFPGLRASLPWMDLGGLPTPVSHQQALGERLGLPALYVKHDDRAGEVYGGSKARKLEHLLADALARGARSVLTYGGMGSNHALATAVHTDRLGLGCQLLLLAEPPSDHAREHLLAEHHLGCEQHRAGGIDEDAARRALGPRFDAERPYIIPAGGTSPLGNAGYVNAAFELAAQCDAGELPIPEVIYVALGTTGTAAGLYVGLRAAGLPTRVVAVRASNPGTGSLRNLSATIESTARFLNELDPSFPRVEADRELLRLEHGFAGAGYAIPSDDGRRAAELARTLGALELDPTYTSKAFAALIHDAPRLSGQPVLFWNTYDPRHIPWGEARPEDLPPAFLPYLRNPEG